MAAPVLRWYETDGTTAAGVDTYTPTAGTPTAAQTTRIYNDNGGAVSADDATELRITAFSRDAGGTNFTQAHALTALGYVECRAVGSGGTGVVAQTTEWTPVGKGRYLSLKDLPSDCYRTIETRINAPAGYGTADVEVLLRVLAASPAVVLEEGHHESGAVGVCHGVGDGRFGALLEGGAVTAQGSPDATVAVDLTTWIAAGVPWTRVPGNVSINGTDGAAASLASGESYWVSLSLASDGTVTQTKGSKGTSPLAVSARPTPLSDEPHIAWVEREFDATIESGDIYQDDRKFGWFKATTSGASLVVSISGGSAMLDNALATFTGATSVTLTASDDNYLWLNPAGTMTANVTGIRPADRSLLLYIFTTDGSGVTATVDRRKYVGNRTHVLEFNRAGTLAGSQAAYTAWPFTCLGYVLPFGTFIAVGSTGTASGATTVDVEQSAAGGAFTTIYTDQTYRPSVAYNASNPGNASARPQVMAIQPGARLRAVVDAIPGGTASSDLSLSMVVVEVDS